MEFKFLIKQKVSRFTPFNGMSKNYQKIINELCKMEIKTIHDEENPPPPLTSNLIKKSSNQLSVSNSPIKKSIEGQVIQTRESIKINFSEEVKNSI
jgi:hypothetical protein